MHKDTLDTQPQLVERRTAIKQLAVLCGLVLSSQSLSLMAQSFSSPIDQSRKQQGLLKADQLELVKVLGELIIPTTDTPGAIAADVHTFIHYQLAYCFNQSEQQNILNGLATIDEHARQRHKKIFIALDSDAQIQLLQDMEAARKGFTEAHRQFFKQFKSLVMFGYYTSEIGATRELAYLAIPGGYRGDFKFSEVGKAWALNF
jgi:hypothetical protein